MSEYVVLVYGTVRVDIAIEAESDDQLDEITEKIRDAFENHGEAMFDIERDYLPSCVDIEVQTLEDSVNYDGIGKDDCMTLAECMGMVPRT